MIFCPFVYNFMTVVYVTDDDDDVVGDVRRRCISQKNEESRKWKKWARRRETR